MKTYEDLINQFVYQSVPTSKVSKTTQFEAVSAAVFGTKQRRNGPLPPPEMQVAVRRLLGDERVWFLVPWGASKHAVGDTIDILELMAVKQLACLAQELRSYGKNPGFVFRLEDLTDKFLLKGGDERIRMTKNYVEALTIIINGTLEPHANVTVFTETELLKSAGHIEHNLFAQANNNTRIFYSNLVGDSDRVPEGWTGDLDPAMLAHYRQKVNTLNIGDAGLDVNLEVSKYFGFTLARSQFKMTGGEPYNGDVISIAFANPAPGAPYVRPKLHYRTLPERYTHRNVPAWNATGYVCINKEGEMWVGYRDGTQRLQPCTSTIDFDGGEVEIKTPYLVVD